MQPVLAVVGIAYGIFLVFYVVQSFFLFYHLFRFSVRHDTAVVLSGAFGVVTVTLFLIGLLVLLRVPWNAPLVPPEGLTPFSRVL